MITQFSGTLPYITIEQMQKLENNTVEKYGISLMQMMENAGLNLAVLARDKFLIKNIPQKKVVVVAGTGRNSGIAMAAARFLSNWGTQVSIVLTDSRGKFIPETIAQFSICQKMKIPMVNSIDDADLIIDGIFGGGLKGEPSAQAVKFIEMINQSKADTLSIEAPSGLDLNGGKPSIPTVKANATLVLAIPKIGHFKLNAAKLIGDLYMADISIPPEIYPSLKIENTILKKAFQESTLVKINKVIVFN
jgi:NAD(P)H-hydrate epimerase